AVSVAVLAACGPQVPPAQNYGVITGRAYDAATGQGVPGVAVSTFTIYNAVTGSDGTYRINNIPAGSYTIQVTPPQGYAVTSSAGFSGSIALGQTITVDIPLQKQ
ncbi:MAG TPA: carboxypeptidase-like regulatory domain-containing protein, partial [Candidatus Elarobacter sp.]